MLNIYKVQRGAKADSTSGTFLPPPALLAVTLEGPEAARRAKVEGPRGEWGRNQARGSHCRWLAWSEAGWSWGLGETLYEVQNFNGFTGLGI